MRFGKQISIELLEDMIEYCQKLDAIEKKVYGVDTFKGRKRVWVDKLSPSNNYVIYGNIMKTWFAEYYDWEGNWLGNHEDTEPFDYKGKEKEMKE